MDNSALRSQRFARLALIAFTAMCAGWLLRLDYAQKISTNVLDLIPPAEQSPEIGLIRGFASGRQARVMLLVLRDIRAPETAPTEAAAAFAAGLRASPAFAEVVLLGEPAAENALGRQVFDHRLTWLLPSWLGQAARDFERTGEPPARFASWLATRSAGKLEDFLSRPEATAMQDLIPRDPLLLVPALLERAQGIGAPGANAGGNALVWAQIKDSPFADEGQGPVFAAIERSWAKVRVEHGSLELRWTGVNRFAAASRARIESEIGLLNVLSITAVLGISCVFVRRIYLLIHLVPVILLSLMGAWTVSTLVFERLHILVFVVGSLLSGVAIDYGFYIFMQPSLRPEESYGDKLRRLLKPLLASCLTTVIGFSLLLFSDLPLIRQIGLFVSAGLLCALGTAMLYFAQLHRPLLEGRVFGQLGGRKAGAGLAWVLRVLAVVAAGIALTGPLRLHWRDDVRELDLPSEELRSNDLEVRARFGESEGRAIFLTFGPTLAEARRNLEVFLNGQGEPGRAATAGTVGLLLPTEADYQALAGQLARLASFEREFQAALRQRGFTPESFEPFFTAWNELLAHPPAAGYAALAADLDRALTGPLSLLSNLRGAPYWFLTMVDAAAVKAPAAEARTIGLNQLQSLNELFTRYRWSALRLSLIGLGLVIASVFVIYPSRRGIRIALIPAGACFFVFGVLGLAGQTLNLFHLLGAFLGVCLSHNYAIFSSENAAAGVAPPVPVRLSAFCTAASFGVLACSRIPVVHALGLTVALIVAVALAVVELEPLARRTSS